MRATFCDSLKTGASWNQGTSTFTYPQATNKKIQLNSPSYRNAGKVDCDNAVPFCDFTATSASYTYYLEMDWYGTRYRVPSTFDSTTAGFLLFDPSTQKFYVSGYTYTVDRQHSGPIDLYLCYDDPAKNCSPKHVLTYNDNCSSSSALTWTGNPINNSVPTSGGQPYENLILTPTGSYSWTLDYS